MAKLFFVGDSITAGAWDGLGGWANRLIGQIMQETVASGFPEGGFYCLPYNLGVSGDTVEDILLRLENEITARLDLDDRNETVQIVFAVGVNDSIYMVQEDRPRVTDEAFLRSLEELVALGRKFAQRISFIGLLPVDDRSLNPIPWAPDKAYENKRIKKFEDIIAKVAKNHDAEFLPMFDRWLAMSEYKTYLVDGVHPDTRGHERLAAQIREFLMTDSFKAFHTG